MDSNPLPEHPAGFKDGSSSSSDDPRRLYSLDAIFLASDGFLVPVAVSLALADFAFSRAIFRSLRMEASAAFTTAGRLSRGMVSAASKNARVKVFVPRNARVAGSAMSSSFKFTADYLPCLYHCKSDVNGFPFACTNLCRSR